MGSNVCTYPLALAHGSGVCMPGRYDARAGRSRPEMQLDAYNRAVAIKLGPKRQTCSPTANKQRTTASKHMRITAAHCHQPSAAVHQTHLLTYTAHMLATDVVLRGAATSADLASPGAVFSITKLTSVMFDQGPVNTSWLTDMCKSTEVLAEVRPTQTKGRLMAIPPAGTWAAPRVILPV